MAGADLILQGLSLDDLINAVADAVLERLRPILAESSAPMLVNSDEMARLVGISRPTIDRAVRDGTIPSVLIGRRRLFRPGAVIDAFEAGINEKRGATND